VPAEALCLEVNLYYCAIDQDWWNTPHEQLCEPVAPTCCSKKVPAPPVEAGLETRFLVN
jgi:hypothetical protein